MGGGLSLLLAGMGFAICREPVCIFISAFLAVAGIIVLVSGLVSTARLPIEVKGFTDHLSHILHADHLFVSGLQGRTFAVLKVKNKGTSNLTDIVAKYRFPQDDDEESCVWSLKSGEKFVPGGSHSADLSAGDSRLLVVAQSFRDGRLWARLSPTDPFEWPLRGVDECGAISYVDTSGNILSIASETAFTVRFQADGFRAQLRHLRFDFDGDEPRITPRGVSPQHQPSVIERLREWERSADEMQELRDDFCVAAAEALVKFREMRSPTPPAADVWPYFKSRIGRASFLAQDLRGSYGDRARALIRPLFEVEPAALGSVAVAAAELHRFVLGLPDSSSGSGPVAAVGVAASQPAAKRSEPIDDIDDQPVHWVGVLGVLAGIAIANVGLGVLFLWTGGNELIRLGAGAILFLVPVLWIFPWSFKRLYR
jgi:hypothetical protein